MRLRVDPSGQLLPWVKIKEHEPRLHDLRDSVLSFSHFGSKQVVNVPWVTTQTESARGHLERL